MTPVHDLVRVMLAFPGSQLVELRPDDLAGHAIAYACGGFEVFPLSGKVPVISKADGGNGLLDATTDLEQIAAWWERYRKADIGGRGPEGVAVLDVDPRHRGLETLMALEAEHGQLVTLTTITGRGDGGRHLWFRHPGGQLTTERLPGWDPKLHTGYVVLPPSVHPDTGDRYRWDDPTAPIVTMPDWLVEMLRPAAPAPPRPRPRPTLIGGDSPADWYTETHTWAEVLQGWECKSNDGDADGARWRHPDATSPVSVGT